jgi:ABC-type phosphate/phosphonate transport system substrate-binding protein|tara:strand:+ start:3703 stop:3933 length:231 start_codon:yes stop_codon:yes gene_type:complete
MRLNDLKESLKDMSMEQRMELVRGIREDRKISKHSTTVRTKRKEDKQDKMTKVFKDLSPEERQAVLEALRNESETS